MTKILNTRCLLALTLGLFLLCQEISAQSPNAIPYQAVARNSSGNLLQNQPVRVRFSIHEGTASGTVVYQETHTATTNNLGLFSVNIGQGTPVSGTFSGINWGSGLKFTQVELDPSGGTAYLDMGTVQMLSVPYALYAASSGSAVNEGDPQVSSATTNAVPKWNGTTLTDGLLFDNGTNIGVGTAVPLAKLSVDGNMIIDQGDTNTGSLADGALHFGNLNTVGIASSQSTATNFAGLDFYTNNSNRMAITSNGNIGIGTISPSQKLEVAGTVKTVGFQMPTGATGGYVLQTDANGNASWVNATSLSITETDPKVGSSSTHYVPKWNGTSLTDGSIFDNGTNVGIGTANPLSKLHTNNGNFLVTGTYDSGNDIEVSGTGTRMFFTPKKAAFRAGYSISDRWNPANIGDFSAAFGIGTKASGSAAFAIGDAASATGSSAFAGGYNTVASGDRSMAFGQSSTASANHSFAMGNSAVSSANNALSIGNNTTASGDASVALGYYAAASGAHAFATNGYTTAKSFSEAAFGQYNTDYTPNSTTAWNTNDRLFVIGNGTSSANLSNAFTMLKSGNIGIGTDLPSQKLEVNGTTKTTNFQMLTGATSGYVLQSDASGNASWAAPSSVFSDMDDQTLSLAGTTLSIDGGNSVDISQKTLADADADTKIQVEESTDEDKIRFDLGGTERWVMTGSRLEPSNSGSSLFLGYNAGASDDLTFNNNVALGFSALSSSVSGNNCVGIGYASLNGNTASRNTAIGSFSLYTNTTGSGNSVLGYLALTNNSGGSNNVAIGQSAGFSALGSGNTFLGYEAGYNETGSNKLYIDNSSTSSPLIWGDFSSNYVNINGNLGIGTSTPSQKLDVVGTTKTTNFQLTNGATSGYVLQSDASGNASWVNSTSLSVTESDPQVSSSTTGKVPRWTGTSLSDGTMFDDGTNVGIGNTSPVNKLDVEGGLAIGSTYAGTSTAPSNGAIIQGDVGIGTASPDTRLHVVTSLPYPLKAQSSNVLGTWISLSNTSSGATDWNIISTGSGSTDGAGNFWVRDNDNVRLAIKSSNGNVGIGTTSPANKLDVEGGLAVGSTYAGTSTSPTNGAIIEGKVGIGTTSPSQKLDVNGTTKTTNFQMTDGATDGYVLQSDANGNASWVDASSFSEVIRDLGNSRFIGHTSGLNAGGATFGNSSQEDIIAIGDNAGYGAGSFGNLSNHIAIGKNALYGLTGGQGNIAIGTNVLASANGTFFYNTAIGYNALSLNGNPSSNTAIGAYALSNSAASSNTGIGYEAGKTISGGSNNTFLGRGADAGSASLTNATAIGYNAKVNTSNSLVLGSGANVGIGTSSPVNKLDIGGGIAIGSSYAGSVTAPTNGAIIEGQVGIGISPAASAQAHIYSNTLSRILRLESTSNEGTWLVLKNESSNGNWTVYATGSGSADNGGGLAFRNNNSNSDAMLIDESGNVGIGTTAVANKLDVEGGIAIGSAYSGTSSAPANGAIIAGNVGIGTTTPANKLDVEGGIAIGSSYSGTSSAPSNGAIIEGNVGIGTTTPTQAQLVVSGSESTNIGGYGFINDNGNTGTSSGTHNYSIYASDRIAGSEFNAHSDARIKHIQGRSDNAADLQTLMQLKITDYTMVDTVAKGSKPYKKVIAQEVEQVYPQAVSKMAGVAVPDIYQLSNMENGFVALPNSGIKVGARVKLIFGEKQTIAEVTAVSEKGFQTNLTTEHGQVFVYGREVSDFRTVDYEALSMLNVSATQALVKEISDLKKQNAQLHGQMQDLNQWREKVEAMLQTRPHK